MSYRCLPPVLVAACLAVATPAAAQVENESRLGLPIMDQVFDIARVDNTIYVAGGIRNGIGGIDNSDERLVLIDVTTGFVSASAFEMSVPEEGGVNAVVEDGTGGWYAGGNFQRVGSTPQFALARFTRTDVDETFRPALNGPVQALLRDGNTLYVAGGFTTVNGQARGGGAAFDAATGTLLPWNPQLDTLPGTRVASAIAKVGATVFLGGSFTTSAGTARLGFAAVDATTGALLPAPAPVLGGTGTVSVVLAAGNTLYIGGLFSSIAGEARTNLAAIDATTGVVAAFNPNPSAQVRSLLLDGSALYVGGSFAQLGGQARARVGRVDAVSGAVDAWTANANDVVIALARVGTTLYMAGGFTLVGGQQRMGLAAVSTVTGVPLRLSAGLGGGTVNVVLPTGANELLFAGNYTHIGASARPGIAAFDLVTNEPQPPFIIVNGNVRSITPVGNTLYLSGQFTTVNNQSRNGFAAIDRHSGQLLPWNPNVTGSIMTAPFGNQSGGRGVVVTGTTAFIAGYFTSVGGQPRTGLAQVDATTGAVTAFVADTTGGGVQRLVRGGQTLYVGGTFTGIAGQARQALAAFDLASASPALLPLNVAFSGGGLVNGMKPVGSTLYIGGSFASVNGQPRNAAAAVTIPGGALTPFSPLVGGPVNDVDVLGGTVYLAGGFTTVNGAPRRNFAAVDAATGQANGAFDPDSSAGSGTRVMASSAGLVAGSNGAGEFLQFFPTTGLGGLPGRPPAPTAFLPPPGLPVSLFIEWESPTIGGPPTGFRLEIGTGPGLANIATIPTTDRAFFYDGVLPTAIFYARVRAVNAAGAGPASPEIAFATGVPGCHGIAQGPLMSTSVSGPTVTMAWSDTPLFTGALTYSIAAGTVSGIANIGTIPVGAVNQFVANAPPGAYFLKLQGQGPCGRPAPSPEQLVSVGGVKPLDAPVLSAQVSGGSVTLNVTPVNGATGYLLDAGSGPLHSFLRVPMPASGLTAAAPPGTYYVRAYAVGGPTGRSHASNEVVVVVP
jgi:hypothetical protein